MVQCKRRAHLTVPLGHVPAAFSLQMSTVFIDSCCICHDAEFMATPANTRLVASADALSPSFNSRRDSTTMAGRSPPGMRSSSKTMECMASVNAEMISFASGVPSPSALPAADAPLRFAAAPALASSICGQPQGRNASQTLLHLVSLMTDVRQTGGLFTAEESAIHQRRECSTLARHTAGQAQCRTDRVFCPRPSNKLQPCTYLGNTNRMGAYQGHEDAGAGGAHGAQLVNLCHLGVAAADDNQRPTHTRTGGIHDSVLQRTL